MFLIVEQKNFDVDMSTPTFTETSSGNKTLFNKEDVGATSPKITFGGTVTDTNKGGISSVTYKYNINDQEITGNITTSNGEWKQDFSIGSETNKTTLGE